MTMNICIFSALYAPHVGGVEVYTRNLAHALAARGHNITVVTCALGNAPIHESDSEGVTIVRIPCHPLLGGRYPVVFRQAALGQVTSALKDTCFDGIVINTHFYPLSIVGASFASQCNLNPLIIEHGSAHLTFGNSLADAGIQLVEHRMAKRLVAAAPNARWYGVSQASSAWLKHFGIEASGRLSNAIDTAAFRKQAAQFSFRHEFGMRDDETLVCFVGRLEPEKGIRQLIQAASLLAAEHASIHLAIAGSGSLERDLDECSTNTMHFLGQLDRAHVAALLLDSDALCLPSRSEGFATILLEAAACDCMPIATDVGGAREIIQDDTCGIILPDGSPETIAQACRRVAQDRAAAHACGKAARQRVEDEFSWDSTATAVERELALQTSV